ncbi:MAG: hypothetical protein KUG61_04130 [Parvibaculaceae bacterium]|nr:hypothetical protein [Parvibaculaceae bacterium]
MSTFPALMPRLGTFKSRVPLLVCVLAFVWVVLMDLASHAYGQAPTFSGRYDGIGIGVDAVLSLEELEGRVVGRLTLKDNKSFSLNGRRSGDMAQGSLMREALKQFFHIEHRALGVQLLIIPAGEDGVPLVEQGQDLSFIRQGVQLPKPVSFKKAPTSDPLPMMDFLDEFRNWSPHDLARVYVGLKPKDQGLISLFDYASAEILWRICVSAPPHKSLSKQQLSQLLARQATDCSAYLKVIARVRDSGQIDLFIRRANFQFELIRKTYACNRAQKSQSNCHEVNALSAPLISEWRPAIAIMEGLVKPSTGDVQVVQVPLSKPKVSKPQTSNPQLVDQKVVKVPVAILPEEVNVVSELRSTIEAAVPVPQARPTGASLTEDERSKVEPWPLSSGTQDLKQTAGASVRVPMPKPHR